MAVKLLLKEGGRLYLLNSTETRPIKERLETALQVKAISTEVNEADAGDIAQKITELVEDIKSGSIGLHYTGGTKVMAVHAHRTFLEAMRQYHPGQKPVCSYLDARSYEMKFDPQPGQSGFGEKVLQTVAVDLKTVLALHDIKLTKGALETETRLSNSARILAKLHTCHEIAKKWRYWCNCELRQKCRVKDSWIDKQSELESITLKLPIDDDFSELNAQLCIELGLPMNGIIPLAKVQPGQIFRKTHHAIEWLDGKWLEHYVFDEISAIAIDAGLNKDFAMSLDTSQIADKPNLNLMWQQ